MDPYLKPIELELDIRDKATGQYIEGMPYIFWTTKKNVYDAFRKLNQSYMVKHSVHMNEFYGYLGIPKTKNGSRYVIDYVNSLNHTLVEASKDHYIFKFQWDPRDCMRGE